MAKATFLHKVRRNLRSRDSAVHPSHESYKWWLLLNVMIGTFMAVLDSTIVNVGLPKIMASFGVGLDKIEWVITAYMLALAAMLPTSGWLADKFGYKAMYIWGLFLFTLGSFLCGISSNEDMLIISRVIQGLGAGTIQPLGMAIISREFPPHQRGIAIGFWSIAAAASVSFGPLIGGYIVDNYSWPLIFDINVPVGIMAMFVTMIIQSEYKNKAVRKFDYVGFISIVTFMPITIYALTEGNAATNSQGWSAPYVLACFAISIVSLAVFITTELTIDEPLIDLRLLKNFNFGMCSLILFIFSVGMFGSTFLMPLYLQNSLGYTALQSGAVFLPVGIIQGFISPLSGMFADRTNHKIPILLGMTLFVISFFLNSKLSFLTEHSYIMLSLYIRGFAMGMAFTPLSTLSLLEVPRSKMAQASGITNSVRQLGGSFGVAILSTLLTSRVTFHAQMFGGQLNANSPVYKSVTRNLANFAQTHVGSNFSVAVKQGQSLLFSHLNKQAYIQGIDDDFLVAALITFIGALPIIFLHSKKKKKTVDV